MGIDRTTLEALGALSSAGILRGNVLTLGRHNRFFKSRDLKSVSRRFSLGINAPDIERISTQEFTDELFLKLGASKVEAIDASPYEGATIIHDMNTDIGGRDIEQADLLFDGGTSEHVFDTSVAMANISKLVKIGGFYLGACPSNGESGHGFYQFSPEFYFRAFKFHGFDVIRHYLVATRYPSRWYRVDDPDVVGGRVIYSSAEPVYAMVLARKKIHSAALGAPVQSDYSNISWLTKNSHREKEIDTIGKIKRALRFIISVRLLWSLNIVSRQIFLLGDAIWAAGRGIRRVDVDSELHSLAADLKAEREQPRASLSKNGKAGPIATLPSLAPTAVRSDESGGVRLDQRVRGAAIDGSPPTPVEET